MASKNQLQKKETFDAVLPLAVTGKDEDDDAIFGLEDNMVGVMPRLAAIKIAKEGFFAFPSSDDAPKEFKGVILKHNACRTFWESPDITGKPPDCASSNGVFADKGYEGCPLSVQIKEANLKKYGNELTCSECPMNVWGSALKGGRGKACSERHRFFVIVIDKDLASAVPYSLTITPTSLAEKDAFFTDLTGKRIPIQTIVTKFALEKCTNDDGQPYAKLTLKANPKERLPREEQMVLKDLMTKFKASFEQTIDAEDVASASRKAPQRAPQERGEYPEADEQTTF